MLLLSVRLLLSGPLSGYGFLFAAHNLQPARGSAICASTYLSVTEMAFPAETLIARQS